MYGIFTIERKFEGKYRNHGLIDFKNPFKKFSNPIAHVILYIYAKTFKFSLKKNKKFNIINFIMLNFFYFSTKLKKRFLKLNFDNKLVLTQTL